MIEWLDVKEIKKGDERFDLKKMEEIKGIYMS